jgi:hypothetical protein
VPGLVASGRALCLVGLALAPESTSKFPVQTRGDRRSFRPQPGRRPISQALACAFRFVVVVFAVIIIIHLLITTIIVPSFIPPVPSRDYLTTYWSLARAPLHLERDRDCKNTKEEKRREGTEARKSATMDESSRITITVCGDGGCGMRATYAGPPTMQLTRA